MLYVVFVVLLLLLLVLPVWWWHGAPFVPTDPGKVGRLIRLARVQPSDTVCDLGSGDGRLVIACAQAGAAAVVGMELNPFLVWLSRWSIARAGVRSRVTVQQVNFWQEDLSRFSLVVVFGLGGKMMSELEAKLMRELAPGSRVVSNGFEFPTWPQAARDHSLYLYVHP